MGRKYDFCGWATKNDIRCSDGRTIRHGAFADDDGKTVPLVWQHQHNSVDNVLGHAVLENRKNGVYAYCTFNDTYMGENAKKIVQHGDVASLSIYANQLKQNKGDVVHGVIRELSLVLAGANPEAVIEEFVLEHSADGTIEEAFIFSEEPIYLAHSDEDEPEDYEEDEDMEELTSLEEVMGDDIEHSDFKSVEAIIDTMTDDQKAVLGYAVGRALVDGAMEHSAMSDDYLAQSADDTIGAVIHSMNSDQQKVLYYLVTEALKESKSVEHSDEEEYAMKYNVFDGEDYAEDTLSHAEIETILGDGKRFGSLKESVLQHSDEYGIENIEYLFPDARSLNTPPDFIKRETNWVQKFMGATHHTPFSRIKSVFANITADEARARGYVKGNMKVEEVFPLLKRVTNPTTVYKKQKLDRDDIIDITDFNVVAWLKSEMRQMLDEEIARAALIGDGRVSGTDDKISEDCIRPIWTDNSLYTINKVVETASDATDEAKAKAYIKALIKAREDYKGSGNPTFFTTEAILTDMLLIEDTTGRCIYKDEAELAKKLRVKEIVTVEVMESKSRTVDSATHNLIGILVNPVDYNFGADKGGAVNMFDDFDIDYNQEKYLIETRCSGALIKPYSAIALEQKTAAAQG